MAKTKATAAASAKVLHKGTTKDGHEVLVVQYPPVKNKAGRVVNTSPCQIEVPATGYKSDPFSEWICSGNTGTTNHRSGSEYINSAKQGKVHTYAKGVWEELTGEKL